MKEELLFKIWENRKQKYPNRKYDKKTGQRCSNAPRGVVIRSITTVS